MRNSLLLVGLGIVALVLSFMTSSCAILSDGYRYDCQNPDNWETPECTPPICKASGTCTVDLLPKEATGG